MAQKKITLSVDSKVYADFQKYCEKNAVMLSKRIELCMEEIMTQDEEIEKEIERIKKKGKKAGEGEDNEDVKIKVEKEMGVKDDEKKLAHRHYIG